MTNDYGYYKFMASFGSPENLLREIDDNGDGIIVLKEFQDHVKAFLEKEDIDSWNGEMSAKTKTDIIADWFKKLDTINDARYIEDSNLKN